MEDAAIDVLEGELAEICGQLNVLHARLVEKVAVALDEKAWFQWGIHTPAQWLAWQTGLSPHRAREVVRVAAARAEFPAVFAAFDAGALAVDQVAVATRAPAWTDAQIAELAQTATVGQLARVVRSYRFDEPAQPPADPEPVEPTESLTGWFDDAGRYHLSGELDADHGRLVDAALAEARDRILRDSPAGERAQVTGVDALVDIAMRSMDGAPLTRRERFRVNLYLDTTTGRSMGDPITWSDGTAVPDWLADLITCDSPITPITVDGGIPVSVGRAARIAPDRTRRLVEHRDRGCRVPGCTRSRLVQVHHIVHADDGGGCDTSNLICVCHHHHRLHHKGQLASAATPTNPTE